MKREWRSLVPEAGISYLLSLAKQESSAESQMLLLGVPNNRFPFESVFIM